MGRELKRVPLDFDYPMGKVWYGYQISFCHEDFNEGCERCREFARVLGIPMIGEAPDEKCPDFRSFYNMDPPTGGGFQLWETTSEGSPQSPVFETAEALAEWCAENADVFAGQKAAREQWLEMFNGGIILFRDGPAIYI